MDGFSCVGVCDVCLIFLSGLKESAEKLVKKKMEGKDKMTPWEEFLEKKKEKKKEKRKGKKVSKAFYRLYNIVTLSPAPFSFDTFYMSPPLTLWSHPPGSFPSSSWPLPFSFLKQPPGPAPAPTAL